jgi:hypothetical protein
MFKGHNVMEDGNNIIYLAAILLTNLSCLHGLESMNEAQTLDTTLTLIII